MKLSEIDKNIALDIIGIEDDEKLVKFPTLSVCSVCHGYAGFSLGIGKPHIKNRFIAYEIALIQFGYRLQKWNKNVANRKFIPKPCQCECDHDWNKEKVRMHLEKWHCKRCGKDVAIDSS